MRLDAGSDLDRVVTHDAARTTCDPAPMACLAEGSAAESCPAFRAEPGMAGWRSHRSQCRSCVAAAGSVKTAAFASLPDIEAGTRVLTTLRRLAAWEPANPAAHKLTASGGTCLAPPPPCR